MNHRFIGRISVFIVLLSHLGLVLIDLFQWETFCLKKPLIVNTYVCKPPSEKLECVNNFVEKEKSRVPRKKVPSSKKSAKIMQRKHPSVTRSTTQKKPPPTTQKKHQLLKELAGTLAQLERDREKIQPSPLPPPPSIDPLHIDHVEGGQNAEDNYFTTLTSALKEALELPELGMVRLELTLLATGQVRAVRILEAESEKNACYLKRQLMVSQLSPFTEELLGQKKRTFVLTFCNEK